MNKSQRTAAAERIQKAHDSTQPFTSECILIPSEQAYNNARKTITKLLTLRADAERENDALREYANHLYKCRMNNMRRSPFKCTCGLDELLDQQEGE